MWTLITWKDTTAIEEAWSDEDDIASLRPLSVITVGKVIHQTDDYVTIAGTVGVDDPDYGDVTCIPMGCIQHMIELEEPQNGTETELPEIIR